MPNESGHPRILIVGSGAAGVHFALSALERGHRVTMLDVGLERPPTVAPSATFRQLKSELDDPVDFFLGPRAEAVLYPGPKRKHFGFPPSKSYVFDSIRDFEVSASGITPYISFARGGLAEAWTGGCYEYNDADLKEFPFASLELQPFYAEVARRIGVSGMRDDIERFSPFTAPYLDPLPLDPQSERLLTRYAAQRARLNADLGFYLGRSRVATLSRPVGSREACAALGRCLWGCPRESLWTPSLTLRDCLAHSNFTYVPGQYVQHYEYDTNGRVTSVVTDSETGRAEFNGDIVVLAAGTIGTTGIYLRSIERREGARVTLGGLMDNPHVSMPFVNRDHLGARMTTDAYQFHLLALEIEGTDGSHLAHGQITTLRAASVHPILPNLPFDLRTSLNVFRRIRSALGVANVWPSARRRAENTVSLGVGADGRRSLVLECSPDPEDAPRLVEIMTRVRRALAFLGCSAPRGQAEVLALGSSGRYVGTIPMTEREEPHTCDAQGRVRGFANLVIADGAAFPGLPAKNHTFTLMANAARLADQLLER